MSTYEAFAVGMTVVLLIVAAICLLAYVLDSILRMKIFKLFGTCNPVLAWVPFVNSYMLGRTCNGKDGQNIGIFGMSVPNWMYNFGWLAGPVIAVACGVMNRFAGGHLGNLSTIAYNVFTFIYWSSIYSFLYSRLEGRPEQEVRVISIVSAIIGIVGFVKIISAPNAQVYSLDNDEFPVEDTSGGWGNPYGYQSGGYTGGYPGGTDGSSW